MATSRHLWVRDLLAQLNVPGTLYNSLAIGAQIQAEGGNARFNPLNTTLKLDGSTDYNNISPGVAVQEYVSYQQGLAATVQTLEQDNMSGLHSCLRDGRLAYTYWEALGHSPWGTKPPNHLSVLAWLEDVRLHWYQYMMLPIPGT